MTRIPKANDPGSPSRGGGAGKSAGRRACRERSARLERAAARNSRVTTHDLSSLFCRSSVRLVSCGTLLLPASAFRSFLRRRPQILIETGADIGHEKLLGAHGSAREFLLVEMAHQRVQPWLEGPGVVEGGPKPLPQPDRFLLVPVIGKLRHPEWEQFQTYLGACEIVFTLE